MGHEDDMWAGLVDSLSRWGTTTEPVPGRLRVAVKGADGSIRTIEIVMTPDEWTDTLGILGLDLDAATADVRRVLADMGPSDVFAVWKNYVLVPSPTPTLDDHH